MAIKKSNVKESLTSYLDLPWTYTITQEKDDETGKIYIVRVNELPGVVTDAPTIAEAMECIKEAMMLAFRMYKDAGEEIQVPITEKDFAGNIAYRTTSERHYLIAREARKRNMSLSQVIDTLIDTAVSKKL